jgi:hypothetical protein
MGFALMSQAQGRRGNIEEKIEAKKIGYLTNKLDLSPEEAQLFWPVYNMYTDKLKSFNNHDDEASFSSDEDVDANNEIKNLIETEKQKLSVKEEYIAKFKEAIGAEKTLLLLQSERGFKKEMLKSIRKRKEKGIKRNMKEKKSKEDK